MTDIEISKALALAIGWVDADTYPVPPGLSRDVVWIMDDFDMAWKPFDYRDPAVIWPIAERFDCFPMRSVTRLGLWWARTESIGNIYADTAAKAVALAIIGATT